MCLCVGMRREGWVWVGREARGEELPSGARGAASGGRPVSGRTGSALPHGLLWALPSAGCAHDARPVAPSPGTGEAAPAPDCKTECGQKWGTNSPQRLLRPRSGVWSQPPPGWPSQAGLSPAHGSGPAGSNCRAYVDDFFFLNHSSPQFSGLIYSRYW